MTLTPAPTAESELAPAASQDLAQQACPPPAKWWALACAQLATEIPAAQFDTWIRPLPPPAIEWAAGDGEQAASADDAPQDGDAQAHVRLSVPNRFKLDWIRSQYAGRIETALAGAAGRPVTLQLVLQARQSATPGSAPGVGTPGRAGQPSPGAGRGSASAGQWLGAALGAAADQRPESGAASGDAAAPAPAAASPAQHGTYSGAAPNGNPAAVAAALHRAGPPPASTATKLNTLFTFDSLVSGRANQMARTAALHVAGAPGQSYNPLFIYGGVGLGKTHLIHAVGNSLLKDRPDARVLYLHAEQFISDVVKNYQRKTFDELKAKYHSLDLLLIDDVQFFAGKERTQEEFFNTFEALLAKRAHIIMTSDTYPKGLVNIEPRLTSRFDAGLTVAIEPPELEMRVAILLRKAEADGAVLPEDVAFFIAKNVRANVRELEGALRKVIAYARFSHKDIQIALAREALRDLLTIQNRQITVENIQKTVADYYKIKVADMYSKKRPASIAYPRQIAMYLAKELTKKSLPEIGELFGGRDHTTVLHAVRKIAAERLADTELNNRLHLLEQTLKG